MKYWFNSITSFCDFNELKNATRPLRAHSPGIVIELAARMKNQITIFQLFTQMIFECDRGPRTNATRRNDAVFIHSGEEKKQA